MSQANKNNDLPDFLNTVLPPENNLWLEKKSEKTLNYLKQCNQVADRWLDSTLKEQLFQEIRKRTPLDHESYPTALEKYCYFVKTQEALNYPQHWRYPVDQPEAAHCYLDVNPEASELDYFDLGDMAISPDENLLAITTDTEGDELYLLELIDLETGERKQFSQLPPLTSDLIWTETAHQLICFALDETQRPWQVLLLDINTGETNVIFEEPDARFWVGCSKSRDKKRLFIESLSKQSSEYYIIPAHQPEAELQVVCPREEGHEYHVDSLGDTLYIRSNCQHTSFSLLSLSEHQLPLSQAQLRLAAVIEEASETKTFEGFDLFDQYLLTLSRCHQSGQQMMEVKTPAGEFLHTFKPPYKLASVNLSENPRSHSHNIRLELESFNQPPALYEYSLDTRQFRLLKQMPLNNTDLNLFDCQQILIPGIDGTSIPISLTGRKEQLISHQPVPVLLYVYGAYGDTLDPWFSASRLSLMERGVVFATAHIRGGGDCGEHWYHKGRLGYKENSIRDLQCCINALINRGITSQEKLILQGGSAAGIVLGALYNRMSEKIGGMIAEVPFVDVLRTMSRPELPLTVTEYEEWGNPECIEDFWRIRHYSPLDNLPTPGKLASMPPLWIEAGLNDPRVQYWEPAKWHYQLTQSGHKHIWLRTRMDSGHAGGSGRDQSYQEAAEVQSVILTMLGLHTNQASTDN